MDILCVYEHVSVVFSEARRGRWLPLALESQVFVGLLAWVLGTELRRSGRAAGAPNC